MMSKILCFLCFLCFLCLPASLYSARDFDAADDKIDFGLDNALNGVASASWSLWMKPRVDATRRSVWDRYNKSNGAQWWLEEFSSGDLRLFVAVGTSDPGSNWIATTNNPLSSGWHHVAIVYDGAAAANLDRVRFWIDGVEVSNANKSSAGTIPASMTSPTIQNTLFNEDAYSSGSPFLTRWGGTAAELAIWAGTVLTQAEIQALSKGASPNRVRPNPSHYAPLWGVASPEPDLSGNSQNGTVTGAVRADHCPCGPYVAR